jgi:DNA processing protein
MSAPAAAEPPPRACPACARRARLLAALAGRLDRRRRDRENLGALLGLSDAALVRALALPELPPLPGAASDAPALCRHHPAYPSRLLELSSPPAVLHLGGKPERALAAIADPCVAIVGSRAPSDYGREVARALAGSLAATGVCVVSGMAMGIDAVVHDAALSAGGPTLAVLPGGVDVAYPAAKRTLHARLRARAALVSELPAGTAPWRWTFVARNRIVAALAGVTVVVEARARSGTLITAGYAGDLGREVAAVPGPVTASRSDGTNALIRDGAHLVRDARDVLDLLYGVGSPRAAAAAEGGRAPPLPAGLVTLLARVRGGDDTAEALVRPGQTLEQALAGLAELELLGAVRRGLSGRYVAVPGAVERGRCTCD